MRYKICIEDRNSENWTLYNENSLNETVQINGEFNPIYYKLFNNDVFEFKDNKLNLIHSSIRNIDNIACVIILNNNKSYGKHNKHPNKFYYKCIPYDKRLPAFIVPYENKDISFSKVIKDRYVTIKFDKWIDKHPQGYIIQNIGPIDINENYYEYLLYCKSLNYSIQKFIKEANKLKNIEFEKFIDDILINNNNIQDRRNEHIISIDPHNAVDFDDAFNIKHYENYDIISVYISNVAFILDKFNLWDSFSKRVSTIYLPDRKRPMLPTILSDGICSLHEGKERIALCMDLKIENNVITDIRYINTVIRVYKNYSYNSPLLKKDSVYENTLKLCKNICENINITNKVINNISNDKDLITFLMLIMNYQSAINMSGFNNGIYRATQFNNKAVIPEYLPEDVYKYLHNWNNYSGIYIHKIKAEHEILQLGSYIHITSPIRRLVDLLNLIAFQKNNCITSLSVNSQKFYDNWTTNENMEYINKSMKVIRKIQFDSNLLELFIKKPDLSSSTFKGYVFDKGYRNDGLFQYMVYLPELKLTSRITTHYELCNFEMSLFRIFIFQEEAYMRKKIRLQIINNNTDNINTLQDNSIELTTFKNKLPKRNDSDSSISIEDIARY